MIIRKEKNRDSLTIKKLIPLYEISSDCKNTPATLQEGIYSIRLDANGRSLDVVARDNVVLWDYHGGLNQQWYIRPEQKINGQQSYSISNMAYPVTGYLGGQVPDECIGKNGDRPTLSGRYLWFIEIAPNGTFFLRSTECGEYQLLEGKSDNYQYNGAEVVFQECMNKLTNKWRIKKIKNIVWSVLPYTTIPGFCPTNHVSGDREFGGHDIFVVLSADAQITEDRRSIEVKYQFSAEEKGGDYSKVTSTGTKIIYTTPSDKRIVRINFRGSGRVEHTIFGGADPWSCDGGTHFINSGNTSGLIGYFEMIGDTNRDDISDDPDCGCDTRVNFITLEQMVITLSGGY